MDRVSTSGAYQAVLLNLMSTEARQRQIGEQLSTGQVATDLKGYGGSAETLTAMQAATTQVGSYYSQATVVAQKLTVQDQALQQIAGAGTSARQAIANVVAAGDGSSLMQSLEAAFKTAISGLNTTYDGQYLFSGGESDTQPTTAKSLSDLTAAPSIQSLFQNGQFITSTQLDSSTSVDTGMLADKLATPLYQALQAIQAYSEGPNGPFSGPLTEAQTQFLQSQLPIFDTVDQGLTEAAAQNGVTQKQVDDVQTQLGQQQTMLQGLLGDSTNADLAKASTDLQQAQLALQASGQVLLALRSSSLLKILGG
jgi:flagellar hook-associated protein 3 FlgL